MDIYKELVRQNHEQINALKIKIYLLDCCEKYLRYRSSGELKKGIEIAKRYIRGRTTWKELHKHEWQLEGEAFSIEYYLEGIPYFVNHPDLYMQSDLRKIRISECLSNREAKEFLEDLAFFIVYTFGYAYRAPNDFPPKKYNRFLCPRLFERHFG